VDKRQEDLVDDLGQTSSGTDSGRTSAEGAGGHPAAAE
jgi:hypothetical protein